MDTKLKDAIDVLYEQLNGLIEQEKNLKRTINGLYTANKEDAPFPDVESIGTQNKAIRPDEFFGMGFMTAVKAYLRMKGRAATAKEIFDALKRGGYEFSGDDKIHWRGFTINMSKNKGNFVYVKPSDSWGLPEFYPGYKKKQVASASNEEVEEATSNEEENSDEKESLTETETEA